MLMEKSKIYFGCSSFNTSSWKTLFYPEDIRRKDWFDFYAKQFNTYEFNGSFYKFPEVENLLKWYDKTPDDFRFSIKVPKLITHNKRLKNCKKEIAEFYSVIREGLKSKLACVLWQFSPGFDYNSEKLELIISSMNPECKNVIEFRNISWWRNDVLENLSENGIIFCNVNYPNLPNEIQKTSDTGYVRMHGNPKLFYSEYTQEEIESLYKNLIEKEFKQIYVYFNNTASSAGIINALQFRKIQSAFEV